MKYPRGLVLTLGLVAVLAGPAAAQGPPRGFGARMGTYSGLLVNESVQKELKLDEKQVEKSKELDEKINGEMREKFSELQDLEPQERRAKFIEINHALGVSALKSAGEFLKPEQVTRLKQIAYQQRGINAFSEPDVAKKLNLTETQKSDIQTIQTESFQEMRTIFEENQDDPAARMKKMEELRKQILAKAEAKLNDEQKKTWKDMLGTHFQIKFEEN